jgi:Ni2+-binding GTPase involved in maturation of urease and hydrogenase
MVDKQLKILIVGGPPAAGKTSVISQLIKELKLKEQVISVCKIDCLNTEDDKIYNNLGVNSIVGLSKDICPDHYLAINLEEISMWATRKNSDILIIETAGLCHRCAPSTKNTIAICVLDCIQGIRVPEMIGPVLSLCDIAVITKTDLVSQAESEVFYQNIKNLNNKAKILEVNGNSGTGASYLNILIEEIPVKSGIVGDTLRTDMPSAICSYCVGERRIGNMYQQGVISKMEIPE